MKPVRWGLLCTAGINRHFIPAVQNSPGGELVAVASRDKSRAKAYAAEWKIPAAFGSYGALLDSPDVDAVYISLPNLYHCDWSIRALEAGKHVLCEKPIALTLDQVDRMIDATKRTGRRLAEAFMYLHHPQTKAVAEIVRSGRLGEIVHVSATFHFVLNSRENIRLMPELGGGSLWDVGVYPVSFAQMVMGEAPQCVTACQTVGDTGVDESFAGQLLYSGGRTAHVSCGFRADDRRALVIGTKGRLALSRPYSGNQLDAELALDLYDGERKIIAFPHDHRYIGEVEDMQSAIVNGTPNYLSMGETRKHIQTALALYQAAASGEPVALGVS